jgi:hypothetical protein
VDKLNLELICTTQNKNYKFYRFIESLVKCSKYINLHLILIDQCNKSFDNEISNLFTITYIKSHSIPLSVARNIGMNELYGWEYVSFPDDDCWYNVEEVLNALKILENSEATVMCTNVYDPIRNKYYGHRPIKELTINRLNILDIPISVGLFFKTDKLNFHNLSFNEELGAGTMLGSGEETEFLVKLFENGLEIIYNGKINVYHEIERLTLDAEKSYKYSLGYSALVSSLIKRYHWSYSYTLLKLFLLSLLRFLISNNKNRNIVYFRLKGFINGFNINIYSGKNKI